MKLFYLNKRSIENKSELPENAVYYSNEEKSMPYGYVEWTVLYDNNFKVIEEVVIKYTQAVEDLTRIVKNSELNKAYLKAYDLIKLNEQFSKVEKNEDTSRALEAICDSLKK